jgi:transposase
MPRVNRYYRRSKISEAKFRQLVRCFALDMTATMCAELTGLSARSVNAIYLRLRHRIAAHCQGASPFSGECEVDESYFGARRQPTKRGRGAAGKTIVFGIFKRNGSVYTEIVPNCSKAALQAVIRGRITLESVIHSDQWRGYNGLVDVGYQKHLRVDHAHGEFASERSHINGIESFWSFAKRRLLKFNGVSQKTFWLHLKECEFRFNHRHDDLYKVLLAMLRADPL